ARAISTPDPNLPDHIFNWTIPNIDSLDDKGRESPPHKVKGLPWYVRVRTEHSDRTKNMKHLSLYLYCGETNDSTVWYADATADFTVCNRNEALSVNEKFSYRFRAGLVNSGYAVIYPWNDLMDTRKGFVKDNMLTVQICLKVLLVRGVRDPPTLRDFTQPLANLSDGTLTIEGKKLYINKQLFSSIHINSYQLIHINKQDFLELLHVLYSPSAKPLNATTCPAVLKLADQFQFKAALSHVERFIVENKDIPKSTLLKWTDQYNLFDAQNACMAHFKKADDIKVIQATSERGKSNEETAHANRHAPLAYAN
ncbi:hypothetical protein PRIPAC_83598, partial [Pristionchus pacificus]|uniref:MATH domain-containing protein n=1 Tax=Pristionchus pacificus TaxID=54126 RepID=A0A2A6BMZ4_PRIPA